MIGKIIELIIYILIFMGCVLIVIMAISPNVGGIGIGEKPKTSRPKIRPRPMPK